MCDLRLGIRRKMQFIIASLSSVITHINSTNGASWNEFRSGKERAKEVIRSNQHEVFIVSIDEMDAIVKSSSKGKLAQIQNPWQKLKNKAEFGANYYASADDLRTLGKLVGDLGGDKSIRKNL